MSEAMDTNQSKENAENSLLETDIAATSQGDSKEDSCPSLENCTPTSTVMEMDDMGADSNSACTAPILSVSEESQEVDPKNALRSPPKLVPAVPLPIITKAESPPSTIKYLTGSMKNTPASLSIITLPASSAGKFTRSTRSSIDPSFAAKQRSFLNRVHCALSSAPMEDTSSCDSDTEAVLEYLSDDQSPEYVPVAVNSPSKRFNVSAVNGLKRRREDSQSSRGKDSSNSGGDSLSSAPSEESKESYTPAAKKSRSFPRRSSDGKVTDAFCWFCHREDCHLTCASCPRVFHHRCLRRPSQPVVQGEWVCPECVTILRAENSETRSKALRMLSLDQLCNLLQFAVDRMKSCVGAEVFDPPVDLKEFPSYKDYVVNPMHLSLLERNIKRKMYGSTEAFVADASWIVHNCIVFNTYQSKLTTIAKNILRVCKQEMSEIENCPDCYKNAYTCEDNWFIKVCRKPHILVWAKLKGFPYWPAKAMRINNESAVDVRFFGAHDRSWVPSRDCFLYSQENPNLNAAHKQQQPPKKKSPRNNLDTCVEEVELHIQMLQEKYVEFKYAPFKTRLDPKRMDEQLKLILPQYSPTVAFEVVKQSPSPQRKLPRKDNAHQPQNPPTDKHISPQAKNINANEGKSLLKKENTHANDKLLQGNDLMFPASELIDSRNAIPSKMKKIDSKRNIVCDTTSIVLKTEGPSIITNVATIAEQRLKKKDARKIGLVDRLHEKLSQWYTLPISVSEAETGDPKSRVEVQSNGVLNADHGSHGETLLESTDVRVPLSQIVAINGDNHDYNKKENCNCPSQVPNVKNVAHQTCGKSSKISNADSSEDSIADNEDANRELLLFRMTNCQPKVMLQKLVFPLACGEENETRGDGSVSMKSEIIEMPDSSSKVNAAPISPTQDESYMKSEGTEQCEVVKSLPPKKELVDPVRDSEVIADSPVVSDSKSGSIPEKTQGAIPLSTSGVQKKVDISKEPSVQGSSKVLVRVLSPEALGIKLKTRPNIKEISVLRKKQVLNKTGRALKAIASDQLSRLIPGVSVSPLNDDLLSMERSLQKSPPPKARKSFQNNINIVRQHKLTAGVESKDVTVSSTAAKKDSSVNAVLSNKVEVCITSGGPALSGNGPLKTVSSKILSPAKVLETSRTFESVPPAVIQSRSIIVGDGRVGSVQVSHGKFVQITTQGSSSLQPVALAGGVPPTSTSTVESLSTKNSSIVAVTAGTGGVPVSRKLLPKPFVVAPVSSRTVLVSSRTGTVSLPRVSVGPVGPLYSSAGFSSPSSSITKETPSTSATPREMPSISIPAARCLPSKMTTAAAQPQSKPHILHAVGLVSTAEAKAGSVPLPTSVEVTCSTSTASTPPQTLLSLLNGNGPKAASVSEPPPQYRPKQLEGKGPVSSDLRSRANRLSDMFMDNLQECLREMSGLGSLEAQVRCLQLDLEHMQWRHQQEMDELRHNTDLMVSEMRDSLKVEAQRAVAEAMKIARAEKEAAIAETKRRQWCAFCSKEALFYCCWNTSYCDYKCQESHWPAHSLTCMQGQNASEERLHGKKDMNVSAASSPEAI